MTNTIYLLVFFLSLTLLSCGGGEHSATDTGSASFGLKFEEASAPAMKLAPSMAPADICSSYGIDSISGTVYNSSNSVIATGGPWACSAHQGTIYNIPPGSNIRITIKGTVSGTVVWQGETTGATIYSGQDTNIGSITMTYTGNDATRPTVSAATPTGTNVPLTSPITVTFSESMAASTINTSTFTINGVTGTVTYSDKTATFTPYANLAYWQAYTGTITTDVTDMAGNHIQSPYTLSFSTEAAPGSAPTTPTGVSATAADKQVTISWTAVSGATSYNIYWSTTSGVTKTNGTKITGATSPYIHSALTNGTTYYYVVTAVNNYGESAASSQTSAMPLPPITSAPTGVSAAAGNGQTTISWSAVSGATSYNLYWSTTTGVTTANGTKITGAASPYTHTGLTNGTTYYYIVTAVNLGGESTASSQTSATPQVPVSGAPTGVSATAGNGQVTIGWSAVTGATSYKVYWSTISGSGTGGTVIAVGNVTSYTHTGLTNETSYYYVVTAVNAGGESAASAQVSATLVSPIPSAPTGVAVTAGNGQATITWNSVSGATSYNIYWSTASGVTKTNGTKISSVTSPYTHSSLTNGTTYYYVVTAVNSYGESGESSQVSAMPSSGTDVTAPSNTTAADFINSGASSTGSIGVFLSIAATDAVGVTAYYASETSTTPAATATGWVEVTTATNYINTYRPFTLSGVDGTKTVYVWFKDAAGNVSAAVSDAITLPTGTGANFKMPDTNQTTSYTNTFGEDHDYTINPPSYTDNGDGTITDTITGLVWQKQDDAITRTWADAGAYCDASTIGGYSDWRLPSRLELISIIDNGVYYPSINTTFFPGTSSSAYWSSTTSAVSTSSVFYVYFNTGGSAYHLDKTSSYYARCIRGGQSTVGSLTDNGNVTVTDNGTLLTWQQGENSVMTWEAALTYCESLSLADQTDWRLPNHKELLSLVDYTRYHPSINTTFFPGTISSGYWSSTTNTDTGPSARSVHFSFGLTGSEYKTSSYNYARCVRGGQ